MNINTAMKVYENRWLTQAFPMKKILTLILVIFGLAVAAGAQDEVPPPMPAPTFSGAQLDQLLGPVALYPDPLIAVMLPAATLPSQIVEADRYVNNGGDPNQMDAQSFDPNVIALAHYPEVLKWMDDNLNWSTQLGQAFENQQQDVMDSVQRLRTDAYNLGNLQSTPQEQVINDNGYIEIIPANPDNIYVPDYQPAQVYYEPPAGPPFITFSVGFIIGPWLCGDFDWHHHHVVYWDHDHPRPHDWWHERADDRDRDISRHTTVWNPDNRAGYHSQYQGDRGWNNSNERAQNNQENRNRNEQNNNQLRNNRNEQNENRNQQNNHWTAPIINRPAPTPTPPPAQHFESNNRGGNDAFIGSQNARDTRDFSNRGAQSVGTVTHTAPSSGGGSFHGSTGGGGGGFHGSTGGGGGGGGFHGGGGGGGGGRH